MEAPTSPLLSRKRHVWTAQWSLPHESAFIVLQKYAWANLAGSGAIARRLFGKPWDIDSVTARELFGGAWISTATLALPDGMTLDGRAERINLPWMRLLCETRVLRFCGRCLIEGYHSLYFQIEALTSCPIHHEPLQTRCPHCGQPAPSMALYPPPFEKPFCCIRCSRPLAGALAPDRWLSSPARVTAIEMAFKPLVEWLERLKEIEVLSDQVPLSHLALAGDFRGERDSIAAFSVARSFVDVALPQHMIEPSRRPLAVRRRDDPALTPPSLLAQHYWPSLMRMYRLVLKELFRSIVKEHRGCLYAARRGVWMQLDFSRYLLIQEPGLCPVAAGYVRWIRKAQAHLKELKRHLDRLSEDRFPAPDDNFRLQLLAEFYSCVAAAYVCEKLPRGRSTSAGASDLVATFMARCSSGLADPGSSLLIKDASGPAAEHWIVLGDPSLLQIAKLHSTSGRP